MRIYLTLGLHFVVQSDSFLDLYPNSMTLGHKFVSNVADIPHHVLVVYGSLYCSGSLIRSRIALTTASCLAGEDQRNIFVKVGASSITGLGQVIRVLEVKIHEYFRYYSEIDNDIAMLFLKDNVVFSNRVKKVIMMDPETQIGPGTLIEVSGWGSQSLPQKYAYLLLSTEMVILERKDCRKIYKNIMTPSNYCAKFQADYHLSDIGGPATFKKDLVGILSHGGSNEHELHVAILTNISYFHKWILLNSKRLLEKYCTPNLSLFPLKDLKNKDMFKAETLLSYQRIHSSLST